jgi:hypothetical protein
MVSPRCHSDAYSRQLRDCWQIEGFQAGPFEIDATFVRQAFGGSPDEMLRVIDVLDEIGGECGIEPAAAKLGGMLWPKPDLVPVEPVEVRASIASPGEHLQILPRRSRPSFEDNGRAVTSSSVQHRRPDRQGFDEPDARAKRMESMRCVVRRHHWLLGRVRPFRYLRGRKFEVLHNARYG